jgi:hypothetical protein
MYDTAARRRGDLPGMRAALGSSQPEVGQARLQAVDLHRDGLRGLPVGAGQAQPAGQDRAVAHLVPFDAVGAAAHFGLRSERCQAWASIPGEHSSYSIHPTLRSSGLRSAGPGVAYPRCTGGRRDAPPEDYGGIWVFNEQFADFGSLFTVGDLNERLADLATVLIPAR